MEDKGEIIIYKASNKEVELKVRLEKDSIWLDAHQIGNLFGVNRPAIVKHINNIYKTKELEKETTCSILEQVAADKRIRRMNLYNLDMIISVGYRVNSKRATQFRTWATKTLKEYFIKGYALNEKRLKEKTEQLKELQDTISLIRNITKYKELSGDEAKGILKVLSNYTEGLELLDQYDYQKLQIIKSKKKELYKLTYKEAKRIIDEIKVLFETTGLFGKEKDNSLQSSLYTIYQTFDKKDLYPSIEEKAANLLYLLVKNHSFVDGNKRIAASLFIWFMHRNKLLFSKQGIRIIDNNMLVALTLMIAESQANDKDMMIKVIVNLIQTE